jgi:hypothetical protein
VSKERARRRAERERLAAERAETHAREQERRARARARRAALSRWLPKSRLLPGELAARRRREVGVTIAILVALNLLVWIVRPDWESRLAAAAVSLLVAPVLHLFVRRA